MALHDDIQAAIADIAAGTLLDGVDTASNTYRHEFENWAVVKLPAIITSTGGLTERQEAWDSELDEYVYPVRVAIGERSDIEDKRRRAVHKEWRGTLVTRYSRQRLPAVDDVWTMDVELQELAVTQEPKFQAWVSRFIVWAHALVTRPIYT